MNDPHLCLYQFPSEEKFGVTYQAKLPEKSYDAAGYDLFAAERHHIYPHGRQDIGTKLAIWCSSHDYFLQVVSRSGLAKNQGLMVMCGIIDPDYRGEIRVVLTNTTNSILTIEPGTKIAQFLILPKLSMGIQIMSYLPTTERGSKGFGSTG